MSSVPGSLRPAPWASDERPRRGGFSIPSIPPSAIAVVAIGLALVAGRFFADGRVGLAAALVLGVCYAPLVLLDLPVALAVYVAILYFQNIRSLSVAPNTVGALVFFGWLGTLVTRTARPAVLREQSRLLLALGLLALWLLLALTWAQDPARSRIELETWIVALVAFVVAMTALRTSRDVAVVAVAFIVGAVISVVYGIESGALSAAVANSNATAVNGRLTGGGGDPNVQAAGFIAAMFLCAGLWSLARSRLARVGLLLGFIIVAIGFFATQSRGGLLALAFAAIVGLVVLPRQRKRLIGLAGAALVGVGVVAIANPTALARMTDFGGGTTGRSDLWTIAFNVFKQHPVLGVGLNNFQIVEPRFTLTSGPLSRVDLVAESPHLVHNVYLQLLTDTGVVGLALFLVVVFGALRTAWLAAQRFDASGNPAYGDLARAVLMGAIAMLTALFFISDGNDWRLWLLLGMGPALLTLARRMSAPDEAIAGPASPPAPEPVWRIARR